MIATDKQFLDFHKGKALPPENEKAHEKAEKMNGLLSAIGGALVTYATTKSFGNNGKKSLLQYSMALVGGALLLNGALGFGKKPKET